MAYSRDYPNSIIPKGSKVVECLQNDDKELKRILGILSDIGVMSLFGSKRQCVLHAATGTDGKPSYLTANGLNVAINGSETPVIVTFAGGYNANGTVDKTDTIVDTVNAWTMPANGTYYLYIDKDMSTGILSYGCTTIPDTYATTAPASPVLDQCYFNTVDMKMYHYNSSAWEQKLRVFVAKAVTTADTATLTIYPFTSRTTASNFIQYDGNGNLQAVDLAGALTQLSASKFIGTIKGDIVGNADTATKALAADTATKATNDKNGADIADTYLPKSGGTMTGNLTVPTITGHLVGTADNATKATQDKNGKDIADTYLPKSGGTMTGDISWTGEYRVYNSNLNSGFYANPADTGIYDWKNTRAVIQYVQNTNTIKIGDTSTTTTFAGTVSAPTFSGHLVGTADQLNGYTAAHLIGVTSHDTNGYHIFPDGTIIQWGIIFTNTSWVSFPTTFPSACLSIIMQKSTNNPSDWNPAVTSYNSSGFSWKSSNHNGDNNSDASNSTTGNQFWFAIGY